MSDWNEHMKAMFEKRIQETTEFKHQLQQAENDKLSKINNEIYELVNEDKKTYTSKDIVKRLNRIILLLHGEQKGMIGK